VLEMFSDQMPHHAALTCKRCQRQYTRNDRQISEAIS
jgi:hypothetical protein